MFSGWVKNDLVKLTLDFSKEVVSSGASFVSVWQQWKRRQDKMLNIVKKEKRRERESAEHWKEKERKSLYV
jgi:hypothetical protein